jgi:hypothetical protein
MRDPHMESWVVQTKTLTRLLDMLARALRIDIDVKA